MERQNIRLYKTLDALQVLRTNKNAGDTLIHSKMDEALKECKDQDSTGELETLLRRMMLHVGDVSRQHNILKRVGVQSNVGGAQERSNFRSLMRWWEKKMPKSFYKESTLEAIYEFTIAENLVYNEIRTDRKKGTILKSEYMDFDSVKIAKFIAKMITKGKNVSLWAKHLPKVDTSKSRTTKKQMKMRQSLKDSGATSFKWTLPFNTPIGKIKVNGLPIDSKILDKNKEGKKVISVKDGDIVSYPREKQKATIEKQKRNLKIIKELSKALNLDVIERKTKEGKSFTDYVGYRQFRKKQDTAQQKICSGEVFDMSKIEFKELLSKTTSGTQFRIARMVAYKAENGELTAKEGKWERLGEAYVEWVKDQEKVADKLRTAAATGDETAKKKLMKDFKVKTTGMQTIDMLAEVVKGELTNTQIDNAYQSLIEKMDMVANVFTVVDGSGSMGSTLGGAWWGGNASDHDTKYNNIKLFDVAATLAIAFSTRNPEPEFRNVFGWFSSEMTIVGDSKFINDAPNRFLSQATFRREVSRYSILSEENTFTKNLQNMKQANPGIVSSTNIMAIIDYFVKLINDGKFSTEQVPQAILIITDNEGNSGAHPRDAIAKANSIGWHPLIIFWGLKHNSMDQYKNIPNLLHLGGFNESNLSQILRGIKSGSINPEDELWSIFDDARHSVIS